MSPHTTTARGRVLRSGALVAVAVSALALTGCADTASGSSGTLRIAMATPLTGSAASYGLGVQQGIELAVQQINDAGGIDGATVELNAYDDKCDPTSAATAANTIVSDTSYVAVVGSVCSSALLAGLPIYERAGLPVFASSASSPAVAEEGYEGFARITPADNQAINDNVRFIIEGLGYTELGLLYPSDDYGQSLVQVVEEAAAEYGAELVASETYVTGQTNDYSAVLSNIAATDPDVLILGGYYADMGTAVSQASRSFGEAIPMVGSAQTQTQDFVELAGAAGEGTWITTTYDASNPSEANQSFVAAFEEEFGETPGTQAALGFDNIMALAAAIEQGGLEDLAVSIRAVDYEGVTGPVVFDEQGDNIGGTVTVMQLRDGAWVLDADLTASLDD